MKWLSKMRIAYLFHWNSSSASGVFKKIVSQIKCWSAWGETVGIFILSRQETKEDWVCEAGEIPVFFYKYRGFKDRFDQIDLVCKDIIKWKPHIVYQRYDLYYSALEKLSKIFPLVLEINTDDVGQYSLDPRYRYWYNRLTRGRCLSQATGLIFVSNELAQLPQFTRYCNLGVVIGNGIDLSQYQHFPAPNNSIPRLVFIGSPGQTWSGVDKILDLAELLNDWEFNIIGYSQSDFSKILPSNVLAYGLLQSVQYASIMAKADVAIGTIGLHRIGINEASSLKVRECLAYGIPTVIGYRDTDFPQPVPYLLQIGNCSNNLLDSVMLIKQFVKTWKGYRVSLQQVSHLDVKIKEKERLLFFQKVLEKHNVIGKLF